MDEQDLFELQQLASSMRESGKQEAFIVERFGTDPDLVFVRRISFCLMAEDLPSALLMRDAWLQGGGEGIWLDRTAWIEKVSLTVCRQRLHIEVLNFDNAKIGLEQEGFMPK